MTPLCTGDGAIVMVNRGFVADGRQREAFGAALRLACSPGRLPLLYHCSSGKDRTGWMTAIVHTALGVPRELVLRDYLLSNDFHRTGYQKLRFDLVTTGIVDDPELLRPIMEQSATYLSAAFEEVDRGYPSFGAFLERGLIHHPDFAAGWYDLGLVLSRRRRYAPALDALLNVKLV